MTDFFSLFILNFDKVVNMPCKYFIFGYGFQSCLVTSCFIRSRSTLLSPAPPGDNEVVVGEFDHHQTSLTSGLIGRGWDSVAIEFDY